jgi:two-component system sensor histidine kinase UhpB
MRSNERPRVTNRREAALEESEQRFRQVFDQSPIGAAIVASDYHFVKVNSALCHIMGYAPEELTSLRFSDITHPDHLTTDLDQVQRLTLGKIDRYTTDKRYVRKDGRIVWGHLSVRAMRDAEGHLLYFLPMIEDITLQKRVERLIHAQRDLAVALNEVNDLESGLRLCLRVALDLSEMTAGGAYLLDDRSGALDLAVHQGLSSEFVSSVAHLEADSANVRLVMAGKAVYSDYPALGVPQDEAARREGLRGIAVIPIQHEGHVMGCLNVASRTMEDLPVFAREAIETIAAQMGGSIVRLRAQKALGESEERFHLAVEGTMDGLWDWPDTGQDRQWWSRRFCELLGYQECEIQASNSLFNGLVHPQDLDRVLSVSRTHQGRDKPFDIEFRLRTRSGEYRWFSARGAIVWSPEGKPYRMSGSIRDITDRRKAQAERATYQAKLKNLTAQLALAEERERRRIAVGVHDGIGQKLVLAKLELQSLRQTIRRSKAAQGVDRVCGLIDQTMEDTHSLAFELSNPVLYEVGFAAAIESWLTHRLKQKAGLSCDFASELGGIRLDESVAVVLFQAVCEVLTNVVKHARANHVTVYIRTVKNEVQVVVQDDGVGFDPALLERSAEPRGGLGLFIVRERLEYLRGRVEIQSAPGRGAKVTLTAPFKVADRARPKAEDAEPETRT